MRLLISSVIMLCSVITLTVTTAVRSNILLKDFKSLVDEAIPESFPLNADTAVSEIEEEYEDMKPFLLFFMYEEDVRETEMYIQDVKRAIKSNDEEALQAAKCRLMLHVEQLRRHSVFSFEAIF